MPQILLRVKIINKFFQKISENLSTALAQTKFNFSKIKKNKTKKKILKTVRNIKKKIFEKKAQFHVVQSKNKKKKIPSSEQTERNQPKNRKPIDQKFENLPPFTAAIDNDNRFKTKNFQNAPNDFFGRRTKMTQIPSTPFFSKKFLKRFPSRD